jgi:hypothetical protein
LRAWWVFLASCCIRSSLALSAQLDEATAIHVGGLDRSHEAIVKMERLHLVRALTCELLHTQCLILCYLWTVKYNEGENIGLVAAEKLDGPGCMYRKLKSGRNDGKARRGLGVNE